MDQFLALRSGADGIDGTEDDPPIAETQVALGIPPQQLAGLIGTDQVLRVVSVGKSGDVTRTVRVVFVKGNNQSIKIVEGVLISSRHRNGFI